MVGWRVVSRVAGLLHGITQPGFYTVPNEEKELIQTVWKHFAIAGEWPSVQRVQSDLHRAGDVRLIAKRTGSEMVCCDWSNDGTCRLSLAAVALCDGSGDLVELYLRAVRYFASRYVEDQVSRIDSSDLVAALDIDDLNHKKLRCVIGEEHYFVSISGNLDGLEYTVDFTPTVAFFGDVKSLEEYLAAVEKTRSDSLEAARRDYSFLTSRGTAEIVSSVPEILEHPPSLKDAALNKMVQADIEELLRLRSARGLEGGGLASRQLY